MNCCQSEPSAAAHDDIFLCCVCAGKYHYECLNVTHSQYVALSAEFKSSWKCPPCNNVTRRLKSNVNTPVRSYTEHATMDNSMDVSYSLEERSPPRIHHEPSLVTEKPIQTISSSDFNKFSSELNKTLSNWRSEMNKDLIQIRNDINSTMANIHKEINSLRTEQSLLKQNVLDLRNDVASLQTTTQDLTLQYDILEKRTNEMNGNKSADVELMVSTLETKIDTLEQQARQCNVEIGNLPERRNENLPALIEAMGLALKCPVTQQNIVAVHRVPHAHQQTTRPKNVIVRFTSCIHRDNLLSAFRKASFLKTDQIGLTGTSSSIYINEHLTLKKKQLFRKARDVDNYKYVWIRNATILVREREGGPSFAIRGERDLDKIRPKSAK
ncbi:hypothetical protein HW555_002004 [Spodoptera exigua]|uniref:FP protein C-terminal domain-containing protein n=1 Tax=Spodoptera exigua TaxID=7107 RepID=A0A835GQX3_SPOEX|nr:hypothetical protein HW555_002004 [Spodoptera exigua]